MKAVLASLSLCIGFVANAQFTSGFENWNDTDPADWMGSRTNLSADSVSQVATDVHGGSYAVRLQSREGHKILTTQPMEVFDGTTYVFSFWVRGTGSIRTALYDRRPGGPYSPFNEYYVSSGNSWVQVTQQIAAANDTIGAEFVLSVYLTSGPEDLVVDDVRIAPLSASIYQIQQTTNTNGSSTREGQYVTTTGVVTGVDTLGTDAYYIQDGQGPWRGIYVADAVHAVSIGDSLSLVGRVIEIDNRSTLASLLDFTLHGTAEVPTPQSLPASSLHQEYWEGVLVTTPNVAATELPDINGEWLAVSATQGQVLVDDVMYLYTPVVGQYYTITGIMDQYEADYKLEPRQLSDIVLGVGVPEHSLDGPGVYPNPANDAIYLDLDPTWGGARYLVMDASGRLVAQGRLVDNAVAVDHLPSGYYVLVVSNAMMEQRARFVIQK